VPVKQGGVEEQQAARAATLSAGGQATAPRGVEVRARREQTPGLCAGHTVSEKYESRRPLPFRSNGLGRRYWQT